MIEAKSLSRRFGPFLAVDHVSLRVPDGAILALLGPNGAGKTTTVRMLAGLLAPSAGEATVAGLDVRTDPSGVRARVGLVTDVPGLYERMTVASYLDFFGRIYGMDAAWRSRRIDELLTLFDLSARRRERMTGFSKGMKQKVALARALLHEPSALFLDEPTSGLDPLAARAVRELVVGLKHASRSIILCTHDLDEAERLADEVAILRQGRMVASDAPAALRAGASPDTLVQVELAAALPAPPDLFRGLEPLATPVGGAAPGTDIALLEYRTAEPRRVNPLVLARLVGVGAQVVSVTCTTRTLEDVYAQAVGEEDRSAFAVAANDSK
jgi:ABC-2 type transport system ATP-binding protein